MLRRPDLPANHPQNVLVRNWPEGWLTLECASRLDRPDFVTMYPHERARHGLPATRHEMIVLIQGGLVRDDDLFGPDGYAA